MKVSVVIPTTLHRPKELQECLNSLISQTTLPMEVIIVINGNNQSNAYQIERELGKILKKHGVSVRWVYIRQASLTHARNVGAKLSRGDIILFLEDDVVLEKDYIKKLLEIYQQHPDAKGVQGTIINRVNPLNPLIRFKALKLLWALLQRGYYEVNVQKQLPSIFEVIPYKLTKTIKIESATGICSYKKELFSQVKFDERLKRYAIGEDKDFSYRVHKLFPGSLYQTPHAKLIHRKAPAGRLPSKQFETMKQVYHLYLFYKLFEQNARNKISYALGRIGDLLLHSILFVTSGFKKEKALKIVYMIEAMRLAISNRNRIKKGDINFWMNY